MIVYFSTVRRGAPIDKGGELVRLDWTTKQVEANVPIRPYSPDLTYDPNLRGNARGGRGIELTKNTVMVASYDAIHVFDYHLRPQTVISHSLMVGLHETTLQSNRLLWFTSTAIDGVLCFDLNLGDVTSSYWPREVEGFQQIWQLSPLEIDKSIDNRAKFLGPKFSKSPSHTHVNAVASWSDDIYALLTRFGAVVNLDKESIVIRDAQIKSAHNLIVQSDGTAIINDTRGRTVRIYDISTGQLIKIIDLMKYRSIRRLAWRYDLKFHLGRTIDKFVRTRLAISRPIFVRGLDVVENFLFVGISPASILCIDWVKDDLVDYYSFSQDVRTCIHGLKLLNSPPIQSS